jgi:hypothetical protein
VAAQYRLCKWGLARSARFTVATGGDNAAAR